MKSFCIGLLFLIVLDSCSEDNTTAIPKAPDSAEAAKIQFRNKDYSTIKIGLATSNPEKPVEWMDEMKDTTSALFREIVEDGKKFRLHFLDDKTVEVSVENKKIIADYTVDDEVKKRENEGTKLRLKFPQDSIPDSTHSILNNYSLQVKGVDGRKLLLGIPRNYDNKSVVLLMKSKEEK